MQPTWKQSPKQSVVYDIRLYTKNPRYQKLHGAMGEELWLPLDPPLHGCQYHASDWLKRLVKTT